MASNFAINIFHYYYNLGDLSFMFVLVAPLMIYLCWRIIISALSPQATANSALFPTRKILVSSFRIFLFLAVLMAIQGWLLLVVVNHKTITDSRLAINNDLLVHLDQSLFRIIPPFWLQLSNNTFKPFFDQVGPSIIGIYNSLTYTYSLGLLVLLIWKSRLFTRLFTAFFIGSFISLPFWYFFPALSPLDGYIRPLVNYYSDSVLDQQISNYQPNDALIAYHDQVSARRPDGQIVFYPITTIPSMHVAWSALLAYYLMVAWPLTAILLVPYLSLIILSTVYTLQHYAVDSPAGLLMALITIFLVRQINLHRTPDLQFVFSLIKHDRLVITRYFHELLGR